MGNEYKEKIRESIKVLVDLRHTVFTSALNILMKGEFKEIDEVFGTGDIYTFSLNHLDNSSDINVQRLVDLIKNIETTTESIININGFDIKQFDI